MAKMLLLTIAFLSGLAKSDALFFVPTAAYRPAPSWLSWFDEIDSHFEAARALTKSVDKIARAPTWSSADDHYSTRLAIGTGIDAASLSASLSTDGSKLSLSGKKDIEGCTCGEKTVADIELPFTPKQDDVKLEFSESERILEIRLNRHAKLDDDAARKLTIKPKQKVTADEKTEHQTEVAAKPSDTLEANEKTLMAKFRAAASVTSAFGAEEAGKNADAKVENTTTQEAGEAEGA